MVALATVTIDKLRVPYSWARMSDHEKASYLANTHQAKDYHNGRILVGRLTNQEKEKKYKEERFKNTRLPYKDES